MVATTSPEPARAWARVRASVRRRPTTAFVVAAFVLTWLVWVPRALVTQRLLDAPWLVELGATWTYGPAGAALLVAAVSGRDALRDLRRRLTRWRVPWRWYAVVLLGPVAFWGVVLAVDHVLARLGVLEGEAEPPSPIVALGVTAVPLVAVLVLTDGLGEETGWRGFALPRMLRRLPDLTASTVLGVLWACWHLPLLFTAGTVLEGASFPVLLLELVARSVVFTWVFRATGGSAVLAILLHVALSMTTVTAAVVFSADPRLGALILLLEWLVAAGVTVRGWPQRRGRDQTSRDVPGEVSGHPAAASDQDHSQDGKPLPPRRRWTAR